MVELKTRKSGWIKSAVLDFIREGALRGAPAVLIEIGDSSSGSIEEVADIIEQLQDPKMTLPHKIVRFFGALDEEDSNLALLMNSCKDYGFDVQVVITHEYSDDNWLKYANWVTLRTKENVVCRKWSEIIYTPDLALKDTPDLLLPPAPSNSVTFLFLSGRFAMNDALEFMAKSKHFWSVIL